MNGDPRPSEARIWQGDWRGIGLAPDHLDVPGVLRWAVLASPVHIAVHQVQEDQGRSGPYSRYHHHDDEGELNVILGDGLVYEIGLDGERSQVRGPAAVWVPPGTKHSANAVEGEGFFLCIRIGQSDGEGPDPTH